MAATASFLQSTDDTTSSATHTFAGQNFGTAVAGRIIVGIFSWEGNPTQTLNSATIGGVSATILVQAQDVSPGRGTGMFYAVVPTGTSGTVVCVLSATSNTTNLSLFSVTGAVATPFSSNSAGGTDPVSPSLNVADGSCVIMGGVNNGTGNITLTGVTENYDQTAWSSRKVAGGTVNGLTAATPRTLTLDGSGGTAAAVAACWNDYNIAVAPGSYAQTGTAVGLKAGRVVPVDPGSYAVTGTAISFIKQFPLALAPGSYAQTGTSIGLVAGRRLPIDPGAYALTGTDITFHEGDSIQIAPSAYAVAGTAIGLSRTRMLALDPGSYAQTGTTIELSRPRMLLLDVGSYAQMGADIDLYRRPHRLELDVGLYRCDGTDFELVRSYKLIKKPANPQMVDPSTGRIREEWSLYFQVLTKRVNEIGRILNSA